MISEKNTMTFKDQIIQGIPEQLPGKKTYPKGVNRAPKRKDILTKEEIKLAIRNALRYFPKPWHKELSEEFSFLNLFWKRYYFSFEAGRYRKRLSCFFIFLLLIFPTNLRCKRAM